MDETTSITTPHAPAKQRAAHLRSDSCVHQTLDKLRQANSWNPATARTRSIKLNYIYETCETFTSSVTQASHSCQQLKKTKCWHGFFS